MPRAAGSDFVLLQQNNVGFMVARQMIGGGAAYDAPADDDDLRVAGQVRVCHVPMVCQFQAISQRWLRMAVCSVILSQVIDLPA